MIIICRGKPRLNKINYLNKQNRFHHILKSEVEKTIECGESYAERITDENAVLCVFVDMLCTRQSR